MEEDLSRTLTSPSGSLRGWRPSLVWLFNHIRAEDRDYLTKEDLMTILGGTVDSEELDEAFEKLDSDGSGRITIDEFMEGFATVLRDAQHSSDTAMRPRSASFRRRRPPVQELFYESENSSQEGRASSQGFNQSLSFLSPQNRESIQRLWQNLNSSDPELISDFEEFISGISTEVQVAQNALSKQREATKQEAIVLDEEIERIQSTAQTKLQEETAILREQAQSKLENQLHEKEEELGAIRLKLEQLENEISASKHNQVKLQHKYEESVQEQHQLLERLETSEAMLRESQDTITELKQNADFEQERQRGILDEQEEMLCQMRQSYEDEVAEVRLRLQALDQQQKENMQQQQHQQHLLLPVGPNHDPDEEPSYNTVPDLLPNYRDRDRVQPSPGSLLEEIMETEGDPYHPTLSSNSHGSDGLNNMRQLAHLDLAVSRSRPSHPLHRSFLPVPNPSPANPSPTGSTNQLVIRRPRSSRNGRSRAGRPVSMFCDEQGWPMVEPGDLPPPGWLGGATGDTMPAEEPDANAKGGHAAGDVPVDDSYIRYLELCKPLDFVESLVVQPDVTFKILIVGNPFVGKSCFLMRLCTNTFATRYASTIGVDFYSRMIKMDDKVISLQMWDTAGQERFQSVTRAYYRGAQGIILMYDVTQEDSFIAVKTWINSIQENMDEMPGALILVGNKTDLPDEGTEHQREVSRETGETFAKIYGAQFVEASAKTGHNVGKAGLMIVRQLLDDYKQHAQERGMSISKSSTQSKCSC